MGGQQRHELGFDEVVLGEPLSVPVELCGLVTRMGLHAHDSVPTDGECGTFSVRKQSKVRMALGDETAGPP
eukprot:4444383-Pyramimonas_sp.AAC.1